MSQIVIQGLGSALLVTQGFGASSARGGCLEISDRAISSVEARDRLLFSVTGRIVLCNCERNDSLMAINIQDLGDLVRLESEFRDLELDTLMDPTVVKLSIREPDGTLVTLTYGVDASIIRSSLGIYYYDLDCDQSGDWYYRWWSTGTGQAAEERHFTVRPARAI